MGWGVNLWQVVLYIHVLSGCTGADLVMRVGHRWLTFLIESAQWVVDGMCVVVGDAAPEFCSADV